MVARLDDLVRAQVGFVADASHQLRSPLTALRLRLENIERDVVPAGRADLDGALAEVERLSRLVDGLLALARADAGAPAPRDVDVRVALSERARAWAALAEGQGVRLEVAPGPPLTASATPDALAQVLDNLLANALDVSPPGAALVLHAEPDPPAWVALHVLDEGPGMTSEARARASTASGGDGAPTGSGSASRSSGASSRPTEAASSSERALAGSTPSSI